MPKAYSSVASWPWLRSDINITQGAASNFQGKKSGWSKVGSAYRKGVDSPATALIPREYQGWTMHGSLLNPAPVMVTSYAPDYTYGEIPGFGNQFINDPQLFARAIDKSWSKLMEQVKGDTSELGATLAEGYEAVNMIVNRASELRMAYKALKRGDFLDFLKRLRVKPMRKHRSWVRTAGKDASELWLEYWFGWSPMIGDIYNSLVVALDKSVSPNWVSLYGKGKEVISKEASLSGSGTYYRHHKVDAKVRVKQGGDFRVINYNLYLANRLGLVNPVAIAWELVPFSFVVDWFSNCGNVISAYTDLLGVQHRYPYTSKTVKGSIHQQSGEDPLCATFVFKGARTRRTLNLSKPILIYPKISNFGKSITRAATAVSLLVAVFVSD